MAERKVYVTKYALTIGIRRCDVTGEYRHGVNVKWPGACGGILFVNNRDAFETIQDAQGRVRKMAAAKLNSLDKQRAKLERLMRGGAEVRDG